jgi:hypothetical protein
LRLGRRLDYLAVRKRDVVGQLCALGRKADGAAAERVAAPVDERLVLVLKSPVAALVFQVASCA